MTEDEPAKARALFNELLKKASFSAESAKVLMRQGWEEVYTFRPFEADGRLDAGDINLAIKKIPRTDEGLNGATFCIARDEQSAPDRVFILLKKTKEISTLYIEQYLQEITQSLREAKNSCARVIEWELVKRKLDLLQVKKDALPLDDGEFLKSMIGTSKLKYKGIRQDFANDETEKFDLGIDKLESRVDAAIWRELAESAGAYQDMDIKYGSDLTLVAQNDRERELILEAAGRLNYLVREVGQYEDGRPKLAFYPPEKHHTFGNLNQVLSTRINVGIKNLLEDYEGLREKSNHISRPVLRMIVAMVEAEAKVFAKPAEVIHPG